MLERLKKVRGALTLLRTNSSASGLQEKKAKLSIKKASPERLKRQHTLELAEAMERLSLQQNDAFQDACNTVSSLMQRILEW